MKDSSVRSDTCSIEPKIPFFLIVAGILNIALWILRIIFQVDWIETSRIYLLIYSYINYKLLQYIIWFCFHFQRCCKKCCDGDNSENAACATCGFLANCACITFYDAIALTLIIIWLGTSSTQPICIYLNILGYSSYF